MLTKMPTETKSKTESSQLNTKYFAGVVIVIAALGMLGGYTIFPMLQSPKVLTLTSNLTNNNSTNYTSPVVKHSTTTTNKSTDTYKNNSESNLSTDTNKSNTSKHITSQKNSDQTSNKTS
jgi:hypothetical protein